MATALTLDIASLLTPASEGQPSGPELRYSSDKDKKLYYAVRDARKKAVDAERRVLDFASMGDEERKAEPGPPDPADWESVRRYSVEALTKSKDLWIAAWLIEALTRLHGFAGLREGVLLAHQLCESFWDDIHPQPNKEDGLQTRFAQLAGLDGGSSSEGTLIAPIMNLPITASDATGHFSLADFKDASELERKDPSIRRRRVEEGAVTLDTFNQAVAETSVEFFLKLLDDLKGAGQAFADFTALLREKEEKYRADGGQPFLPPSSKIREVLDECLRLCRVLTKDILPTRGSRRGARLGRGFGRTFRLLEPGRRHAFARHPQRRNTPGGFSDAIASVGLFPTHRTPFSDLLRVGAGGQMGEHVVAAVAV